jgi:hypothetical protein
VFRANRPLTEFFETVQIFQWYSQTVQKFWMWQPKYKKPVNLAMYVILLYVLCTRFHFGFHFGGPYWWQPIQTNGILWDSFSKMPVQNEVSGKQQIPAAIIFTKPTPDFPVDRTYVNREPFLDNVFSKACGGAKGTRSVVRQHQVRQHEDRQAESSTYTRHTCQRHIG